MADVESHFAALGFPMPTHFNPADFLLEMVNVDFEKDRATARQRLEMIQAAWNRTSISSAGVEEYKDSMQEDHKGLKVEQQSRRTKLLIPITLLHRNFIKSYRDVVAYGIRIAMYIGTASPNPPVCATLLTLHRSGNHDGYRLVETIYHARGYTTFHQRYRMAQTSLRSKDPPG